MRHIPNFVPASTRLKLALCAVALLAYMVVGLVTGYTYLPGKRGGFLLSAIPTLLIVGAASALFLSALLTIIDHYDKRPNEPTYRAARGYLNSAAFYLFVAGPFTEMAQRLLLSARIDIFPHLHGLAENYTLYDPTMNSLAHHVDPVLNNEGIIVFLAVFTGGIGFLVDKYSSDLKRIAVGLMAFAMLCLSTLVLAKSAQSFFTGTVEAGGQSSRHLVHALEEPAKFNAILLTDFLVGGFLCAASLFVLIEVSTGRLKSLGSLST